MVGIGAGSQSVPLLAQMPRTVATPLRLFRAGFVGAKSTPLLSVKLLSNAIRRGHHLKLFR